MGVAIDEWILVALLLNNLDARQWKKAMDKQMASFKTIGTWDLVSRPADAPVLPLGLRHYLFLKHTIAPKESIRSVSAPLLEVVRRSLTKCAKRRLRQLSMHRLTRSIARSNPQILFLLSNSSGWGLARLIDIDVSNIKSDGDVRDLLHKKYREVRHIDFPQIGPEGRLITIWYKIRRASWTFLYYICFGPPMGIGYYSVSLYYNTVVTGDWLIH